MYIYIYGPLPPPFGGVSLHIERLLPYLKEAGLKVRVIDQYGRSKAYLVIHLCMQMMAGNAIHLHLFSKYLLVLVWLVNKIRRNKKIILTIHNDRLVGSRGWRYLIESTGYKHVITVSRRSLSFWNANHNVAEWIPAFVAPNVLVSKRNAEETPGTRLVCSVWNHYEGVIRDYGLDVLARLSEKFSFVETVLYVGDPASSSIFEDALPGERNYKVLYGRLLVAELRSGDIFLRLNREDAYGVSVEEALAMGIPAVASSVCQRAKGATVYSSEQELHDVVGTLLNQTAADRRRFVGQNYVASDNVSPLIEIYKGLS